MKLDDTKQTKQIKQIQLVFEKIDELDSAHTNLSELTSRAIVHSEFLHFEPTDNTQRLKAYLSHQN